MTVKAEKADDDFDALEALESEAKEFDKVSFDSYTCMTAAKVP